MKALSTSRKYLRWLLWPGLALITAGLVAGFLDTWGVLPTVLLLVGALFTLISLVLGGFGYRSFWQSRSTQAGTNAIVATLAMLLILGVVNFLGVQYGPRFDLTEAGLFTLAPESKSVVINLDQPVNVVVFDAALSPSDKQLLDSYQRLNENLTYEQINPIQDPAAAREFNLSGDGREVHLEVDDKTVFVQTLGAQGLNEQDLTNKLAQLGQDRAAVVYFIQGHEEFEIDGSTTGYAQAAAALESDNFTVEPLNLADTAVVPGDANAVVIAGPQQPFFEPEVDALETYLDDGGSILVLVDPQTEPALDPLLEDWGVTLDERIIVDASNTGQIVGLGPAAPLVTTYGAHPITEAFDNGRSFYPLARPVQIEPVDGISATPLLLSNPQSYAETLTETGELNVDTQSAPEGPFNIGVVLTKEIDSVDANSLVEEDTEETPDSTEPEEDASSAESTETTDDASEPEADVSELDADSAEDTDDAETLDSEDIVEQQSGDEAVDDEQREARLVVIGNASFATDGLFDQQLNGDVFLNSVAWLSNVDNTVLSIRPKEITNRRIVMTLSRQIIVIALALAVFPLVGLIGAGITWFRRR
ncbi:MAG: Gldg family protein [Leptolyngbyaceae cyanobacterium]